MDLIEKHKNKVFNTVIIVVALLISYNVIYKKGIKNKEMLTETRNTETKKNILLKDIIESEIKVDSFKQTINKKDLSLMLKKLSSLAKESSVDLISLKPQNEKDYPDYKEYSYNILIMAPSYHHIGNFISSLESSPDLYIIDSLTLRPEGIYSGRNKPKETKLSASLSLSTIIIK